MPPPSAEEGDIIGAYSKVESDFLADLIDPGVETGMLIGVNFIRQGSCVNSPSGKEDNCRDECGERSGKRACGERHFVEETTSSGRSETCRQSSRKAEGYFDADWGMEAET